MKVVLCFVMLVCGCSLNHFKNYKKTDNNINPPKLQENFEKIDLNSDGKIDREEIAKYEGDGFNRTDPETPMWAFFQILMVIGTLFLLPYVLKFSVKTFNEFRNKKRL